MDLSYKDIIQESFFDDIGDEKTIPKLWLSQKQFDDFIQSNRIKPSTTILKQDFLFRQDPESDTMQKLFFILYEDRLLCFKDENKEKLYGIIRTFVTKLEYSSGGSGNDDDDSPPFFFFSHNKDYEILVAKDEQSFQDWLVYLKKQCVLTLFGKKYQNLKVIGKGTFARVLLCKQIESQKEVAVKVFDKKALKNSKNADRTLLGLQNEISIMRELNHSNILKLYEVYEGEYHIYLIIDLLTGGELFDKLVSKGVYSEKSSAICISKLLGALTHLHSKGIMHRDIKPENLILASENDDTNIVLADFGLSEHENKAIQLFKRCGTPGYVAPEILNDQPYNCKVDVFSAGVILYILLTGYSPFYGEDYNEIIQKNKKCEICFDFQELDVKLSLPAQQLLKQMLGKNPEARITAQEALNSQ